MIIGIVSDLVPAISVRRAIVAEHKATARASSACRREKPDDPSGEPGDAGFLGVRKHLARNVNFVEAAGILGSSGSITRRTAVQIKHDFPRQARP